MLEDFTTWTCHVCHRRRPDANISVHTVDLSAEHDLPAGTMMHNIRYCNDDTECERRAKAVRKLGDLKGDQ